MTAGAIPSSGARVLALGRPGIPNGIADLPAFLDHMEAAEPDGGDQPVAVVLICPAVPETPGEGLARRLRGLARWCDTAVVALDVPGSVIELTARVAATIAPNMSPDVVPEFSRRIAAAAATVAVIDSTSRLRRPVPSLGQHARSWLPGAWFAVTPDQRVLSGRDVARAALREAVAEAGPVALAATSAGTLLAEFRQDLPPDVPVVEQPDGGRDPYWGARNWLEFSWLRTAPAQLAEQLAAESSMRCANCGRRTHREVCSYCAAVTRHIPRRQEAATQ
jgi:hypothetical protein